MRNLIPIMFLLLATCGTPASAHEELKKGERVIVYDKDHRRVGTIENRGYGTKPVQMRNNQNQITGYLSGGKTYDRDHRRTGTVGNYWK